MSEKKLIDVELQTSAMGGTIRFLRPKADTTNLSRGVDKIGVGGRQNWLPNSNRNSNKNNTDSLELKRIREQKDRDYEKTMELIRRDK